ncbi:MAG: amidohydrolase family protein [Bryobacteraceae bacterium]
MKHCLVVPSLFLAVLSAVRGESPSAVALKDAHVVTVSGADLPKATVVLRNGLIEQVGADVNVPSDAWVIDGTGLTVYPGFIDALSTWGIRGANPPAAGSAGTAGGSVATPTPAPPATNGPRVRGPGDRPQTYSADRAADMVSPSDSRLESVRAAGFTSAATYPNRGIFMGQGALINLAGERAGDMIVAQPIGQQVAFRVGAGGMGRSFPSSLMGNISYVRQLYLDLGHYKQAKESHAAHVSGVQRPEYDHSLEGLADSPRLLLPADESQEIDRMITLGKELNVPFLLYGLHEAFKEMDQLKSANVPALVSLKWPEKPKDADPSEIPNCRDLVIRDQAPAVPSMFAKAGVRFAFYSDGVSTAPELKKAVRKAMDAGLKQEEAIRALTLTPAEIYGVSDRLGSIEKGKIGNLVVTRGVAFDEKSTIEYVFIDGKQFQPSKELQQAPPPGTPGARRPTSLDSEESGESK